MKLILQRVREPNKPGNCKGCYFFGVSGCHCKRPFNYTSCIDPHEHIDIYKKYKHYYISLELNSNIKII